MVLLFWIAFALGYLWYGRSFGLLAWSFLIHGTPRIWRDDIMANRYVQIVMQSIITAGVLWLFGLMVGFALSRGDDATLAQTVLFMTTMLSGAIVYTGLVLTDKAIRALIAVSPLTTRTKTRLTLRMKGILAYGWTVFSFEFFITLAFIIVGVYTTTWLVGIFLFVLFGYLITCRAYRLPIAWLPGLKTKTQVALMFGILGIVGLCFMPFTRQYFGAFGLSPGTFVNKSVVDTTALDNANRTRKTTKREICNVQLNALKKALEEIKPTKVVTDPAGKMVVVPDDQALIDHDRYSKQLAAKEKFCL